tara:strand:- start:983 stop:1957 length:975 start_codon:yes stop_codon:yes gene_type:complete
MKGQMVCLYLKNKGSAVRFCLWPERKNFIIDKIKYWYRKYVSEELRIFIRKSIPFWVQLRYFYFQTKKFEFDTQGHGEAKKLLEICADLNISTGYYVDIGASDGYSSSATFPFARNKNFSGLSIELDDKKFKKMQFIYKDFKNVHLSKSKVTPLNVLDLLHEFNVPKNFDVLNLDIDSYDLFVIKKLLESFQPKIVSMEINEKIPVPIYFTVNFDENHYWKGDSFYGCSLQAAYEELNKFDYKLYTVMYNNAIFIPNNMNVNFPNLTLTEFYQRGYINKLDRKEKFSYNRDFDILLEMNSEEAIKFINNIFHDYRGKFQLESRI